MKKNETTLFGTIRELGLDPRSPEFLGVADAVLRYVLGTYEAYDCQRDLKEYVDFTEVGTSAQKFRLRLADVAYIHLNLKFFCLNLLLRRMTVANMRKYMREFGIDHNDVVLVRKVLEQRGFRTQSRKHKAIKGIVRSQITKAAFDSVFDTFNGFHPELQRHIRSKVYSKLRFVSMSSNVEFYDFHMDLMCKALQTYIRVVPTEKTPRHIANYLKASLNNHIVNIIKAHTTQKRSRMTRGAADGFGGSNYELPVMSENQLYRAFGLDAVNYENMLSTEVAQDAERSRDSKLSYELILRRFGTTRKRRTFLELLSCVEHDKFTRFLQESDLIQDDQDNVDYSERHGQQAYFKAVCSFLGICEKKARAFMYRVGREAYPEHI